MNEARTIGNIYNTNCFIRLAPVVGRSTSHIVDLPKNVLNESLTGMEVWKNAFNDPPGLPYSQCFGQGCVSSTYI